VLATVGIVAAQPASVTLPSDVKTRVKLLPLAVIVPGEVPPSYVPSSVLAVLLPS